MNESYKNNKTKIINAYNNLFEIANLEKMEIVKIWHFIPELLSKYNNDKTATRIKVKVYIFFFIKIWYT